MKKLQFSIVSIACFLGLLFPVIAFSENAQELKLQKVVSGLGIPWGMDFLNPNMMLISEKKGEMKLFERQKNNPKLSEWLSKEVIGVPAVMQVGQGGLLDVRFAPQRFWKTEKPWVFFTYVGESTQVESVGKPTLFLGSAELDKNTLGNKRILFEANNPSTGGRHFGSRITFDDQGYVFFSMGDRGKRNNAQDLSVHSGSIFRLKLDGSIPEDNPFIEKGNAMPEIWSYGHRNPQGLIFNHDSNKLWSIEHGPRGGDEINHIEKGRNYGWPVISYGREYVSNFKVSESAFKEGMEQPVHYFTPSIAPSSLLLYSGKMFPRWRGALLSGALKLRHLNVVTFNEQGQFLEEKRWLKKESFRIRNVVENSLGEIFIATDNGDIYQLLKKK